MMRWYRIRENLRKLWELTIGMRLAVWLDKNHPQWCWADICTSVGLGYDIPWLWREGKSDETCRRDCERNGSCWCGKLMTPEFRAGFDRDQAEDAAGKGFDL